MAADRADQPGELAPGRPADWRRLVFPLALAAICGWLFFWRLGLTPLEDFDEAYYAEAAREMLQRRDLGTPYFNGQPFLLKPILIYWLIAAAFRLLGQQTEFAARACSAFLGAAVVLLTYWFARRTLTPRAGLFAGLILALSYMWVSIARDASIDMPLTAALTAALFLFFTAMRAPPARRPWLYLAAYPLLGIALLAKGPVPAAVVLCGLGAYLVAAGRLRATLAEAQVLPGLALALAVAAPWYLHEAIHQPAFLSTFLIGEHFGHVHGQLARTEPVWGNLKYVMLYFFPWSPLLPAALVSAFRHPDRRHPLRLAAWWTIAVVVLFSIPRSKLAHYLAPAFPALALLVGAWIDSWLAARPVSRIWTGLGFGLLGVVGALCAALAFAAAIMPPALREALAQRYGSWTPGPALVVILAALALGSIGAAAGARWRPRAVFPSLAGAALIAAIAHVGWFDPHRAEIQAQPRKELAQLLAARLPPSVPVGVYYAKRNATPFYLRRPIVDLGEREDEFEGLVRFLSSPAPAAALTHRQFVSPLRERLPRVRVVAESGDYVVVSNRALPERRPR